MVNYSTQYKDAISYVADNGYMVGVDDVSFLPEGKITRGMMVTLLHNMAGNPKSTVAIPFTDVTTSDWFYDGVRWAYEIGLVSGNGVDKFMPNDYIKKQDATQILYEYAAYLGMNMNRTCALSEYTDASSIDSYAQKALKWALEREIYPKASDTKLEPQETLTRAQMALMITEYGLNVEHIVYGRDNYSFNNSARYFTNDGYYITPNLYNKAYGHIELYYQDSPAEKQSALKSLYNYTQKKWGGSCYGMAVTTILDKMGKIDVNGNYAVNAGCVFDIVGQKQSLVESAINYYHTVQLTPFLRNTKRYSDSLSLEKQLQLAVEDCLNNKGLTLFSYWWLGDDGSRHGHSIVAYDIAKNSAGDYEILAYDNRDKDNTPVTIWISNSNFADEF